MNNQELEHWPLDKFIEYARNPRKNDHAVDRVASMIKEFGFRVPIVATSDGGVVDGHLRLKAARKLKLKTVPVLLADDMSEAQIKAFRISVNRSSELAQWDDELLALEIDELKALDFDLELTGFDDLELDWNSDIDVLDRFGETEDGIVSVIKIEVEQEISEKARLVIIDALNREAINYEIK